MPVGLAIPALSVASTGGYISSKFLYSAIETYGDHLEIDEKLDEGENLNQEDVRFLEESVDQVDEYMGWSNLEAAKKLLGKPEEFGESWGHIMAVNEHGAYGDQFQYEVGGYGDEEINDLLENPETNS